MRKLTFLILLSFSFSSLSLCCSFSFSFFFLLLFIFLLLLLIPFSSTSSSRENQESTRIEKKHEPLPKNIISYQKNVELFEKEVKDFQKQEDIKLKTIQDVLAKELPLISMNPFKKKMLRVNSKRKLPYFQKH